MSIPREFDFIVIGGGSAGYAAARTAHAFGKRIAIVDGAQTLGGLCILRGCMPSKTLIYAAEVLHHAQAGKSFGLDIPSAKVDIKALHARKKKLIDELSNYRQDELESDKFTLFRSNAHFISENEIELDDHTRLKGQKFLIATGSRINHPPIPGLQEAPQLTSDEILDLDFVPESIIVLGGGIVACELAQFLKRIGSHVIQIQRSAHILKEASLEASTVIEQAFRDSGIELHTGTTIQSIQSIPEGIQVNYLQGERPCKAKAKYVFNALGRVPNVDALQLDKANVTRRPLGHIECDRFQQTSNPNIYAAGDCAGPHEIVHIAILQGECAARHAFGQPVVPLDYDGVLKVIFTDPQVASVGRSERDLIADNIPYLKEEYPFSDHGKSILMEATYGYVKILADPTLGSILGAECVGKDASELIHPLSVAMALGATAHDLIKAHWYHPTLSEIWCYPLEAIVDVVGVG
jgi:pyruvate/2-oxoglutarate dehydrogenase complex dihydrolipoamide dehydrogenase (E3) component